MSNPVRELIAATVEQWSNDGGPCPHTTLVTDVWDCNTCLVERIAAALDEHCWPVEPKAGIE